MKISVFGLGYVGIVNIACLSKLGHSIFCCDVKPHKVELINIGKSTILEPQVDELIEAGFKRGQISASTSAYNCIENSEAALICVGTPSDANGKVNMNYIMNTVTEIGKALKGLDKNFTIIFRSTIPPGTIQDVILPELSAVLGRAIDKTNVIFLPEFLREGSAVNDFFHGARIVVGANEIKSGASAIETLFGFDNQTPIIYTDYKTAEFIKYVDNAYHATKVAFANEVYSIGSGLGVNVKEANDIFLLDNILNISKRYLRPGAPFGGSCLPKDSRALLNISAQVNVDSPFLKGVIESNKAHQKRLLDCVLEFESNRILIFGLTFKQNTDDIRESPFLFLLKDLIALNLEVKVYDPNLNQLALRTEFPEIIRHIETDLETSINWAEAVVMNSKEFDLLQKKGGNTKKILNCINNDDYSESLSQIRNLF